MSESFNSMNVKIMKKISTRDMRVFKLHNGDGEGQGRLKSGKY